MKEVKFGRKILMVMYNFLSDPVKFIRIFIYFSLLLRRGVGMEKVDTATCVHVDVDISEQELCKKISDFPKLNFVHIDHSSWGCEENSSIIDISRDNSEVRSKLIALANAGFHLYVVRNGISSLVHHRRISTLWHPAVIGNVKVDENSIFYTVQKAKGNGEAKLLVVFSSIAGEMYTPSLIRHFEKNFSTIDKYIPQNINILRIVDFGSVVGSFYLNSHALPNNEENIWNCIKTCAKKLNVKQDNIVLYGTSKGGTATVFYALKHGVRGVAVDPILSDDHYVRVYDDLHFTQGTFPESKERKFFNLSERELLPESKLSVICSTRSPQYPYIEKMLMKHEKNILILNTENNEIHKHPDVAPKSLPHTLSQINLHLAGLDNPKGYYTVW
ncbi:XcbB/CpsF family capsular polysaccharide biosynthesis protein [Halomonas binhaiensis]|uniref:XcbB/CpsF family capsular polysaccharide biosynthesis protein n=1 Tax=Halomonas binhaiensis TaxID=2562282 RepID=A0A5C1NAN7_9GAMM|nr:XcbB/CpsF family capsular polysaccharide biosynthesis protein [Halomonas binhaiensis]QEM80772.1 XcbB/CpsF family capsular polysaccharide biosynthesis protein [Halomonas binhaiensis]